MTESAHDPGLTSSDGSRIVILERPGCHLCETASHVVHAIAADFGERVEHVNIESHDELARRWQIEIPVIAIDGTVVNVYRADPASIRAALARKPGGIRATLRRILDR